MNSGIVSCPGFAPNPFLCFFLFWGCFFLGLVGLSSSSSLEALLAFVAASTCNACVTTDGGRWPRQPPPPLGLLSQLSLGFLGFRCGTMARTAPLDNAVQSRPHLPALLRQSLKARARMRRAGEQPYCHTNAWTMVLLKSSCLFGAHCARIF